MDALSRTLTVHLVCALNSVLPFKFHRNTTRTAIKNGVVMSGNSCPVSIMRNITIQQAEIMHICNACFNATHMSAFVHSFSLHGKPWTPLRVLCVKLTYPPTPSALACLIH